MDAYYREAEWFFTLLTDPEGTRRFEPKDPAARRARYEASFREFGRFLEFLEHPQTRFRSLQIAGTSGKGSVTTMIAALLSASGLKVGDHTSPYLQLALEKLRIDGQLIKPSQFITLMTAFRSCVANWHARGETLKYGHAWVAFTFFWLARAGVDWGVVETGMGGRFDPTNYLPAELAVITNVDYDHVRSLGGTLSSIAWHKAGIIKPHQRVVTAATKPETLAAITAEVREKSAQLRRVKLDRDLYVHTNTSRYFIGDLPLQGAYQTINAATAITAVDWLAECDGVSLDDDVIRHAFTQHRHPGRFEVVQQQPVVVLDGAHNPHKMAALMASVRQQFSGRRLTCIVGIISGKAAEPMLRTLVADCHAILVSQPHVIGKPAQPPDELAATIRVLAPNLPIDTFERVDAAIDHFMATASKTDVLLITGSIYLVGEARERWYDSRATLRQLEHG